MRGRVLAALVAVALVVGAVVARDRMDGGDGPDRRPDAAGDDIESPTVRSLMCGEVLVQPCDAGQRTGQSADTLIAAGTRADATFGAWLTFGPWPRMVEEARKHASKPTMFESISTLASTTLVAVIRERPKECATAVTWRCLGDAAQASGGARPALAGPEPGTGTRLLVRAALAGAFLDNHDYASNDLTDTPGALEWLTAAERGIDAGRDRGVRSLTDFVLVPGANVFIGLQTDVRGALPAGFETVTPTPPVRVDAFLGAISYRPDGLAEALRRDGWAAPGKGDDGLPSPGVLLALRDLL